MDKQDTLTGPSVGRADKAQACESAYIPDFGWALMKMRVNQKVFRRQWNGKGMYLQIQYPDLHSKMTLPYIYMRTADNQLVPWLASQTDMLACDWEIFR